MSSAPEQPTLWARAKARVARIKHQARLRRSLRHIHGPAQFETDPRDVILVALVRDGLYYLDGFFAHYRSIGVRHFVFVDNGSSDGTIARIAGEPGTIIVQSTLPWGQFENDFRQYGARTYCVNRWCLFADMDEQFDFFGSQTIGLSGLVRYLEENQFTALIAQMLEMFPNVPLRETAHMPFDEALTQYDRYDLGHVTAFDYHDPAIDFSYYLQDNTVANPQIKFLFGGVRHKVFGEDCALTKHPLVFVDAHTQPGVHPHCAAHVACADFTALIRHYKFTDDPFGRDAKLVRDQAISHGEDQKRLTTIQTDPDLTLDSKDAMTYTGIVPLEQAGFLVSWPQCSAILAGQTDD